jgi:hypothetical protein
MDVHGGFHRRGEFAMKDTCGHTFLAPDIGVMVQRLSMLHLSVLPDASFFAQPRFEPWPFLFPRFSIVGGMVPKSTANSKCSSERGLLRRPNQSVYSGYRNGSFTIYGGDTLLTLACSTAVLYLVQAAARPRTDSYTQFLTPRVLS